MSRVRTALLAAVLLGLASCSEGDDPQEPGSLIFEQGLGIEADAEMEYSDSCGAYIDEVCINELHGVYSSSRSLDGAVDLHIRVLPLHVFGNTSYAGDYYGIDGYAVLHNAPLFSADNSAWGGRCDAVWSGYFPREFDLEFCLLDSGGNPLHSGQVGFAVTPEPSTTVSSVTYRKGYSIALNPGILVSYTPFSGNKKALGSVSSGFSWINEATQNLPDQSVEMSTDSSDRTVRYSFVSNNITLNHIPELFRTDQRVDFSWVWHVPSGVDVARPYDFGNMRLKVVLNPRWGINYSGYYVSADETFKFSAVGADAGETRWERTFNLPAINRIPIGTVAFKNTTRNYTRNISVWNQGEWGTDAEAYYSFHDSYSKDQSAAALLREGTYDIVYELVSGEGLSLGFYRIEGVSIQGDGVAYVSTMDGRKL